MPSTINSTLYNLDNLEFRNDQERLSTVGRLKSALARLMTPMEHVFELTWIQPAYATALKTTIDVDLYTRWVKSGGEPKTARELSKLSNMDEAILTRLLRHIVANSGLGQPNTGTYALTPFTRSLAGPGNQDAFGIMFAHRHPAFLNLPSFLAKKNHQGPLDPSSGNWQDLHQTKLSYIESLWQDSQQAQQFHRLMKAYNSAAPAWVDVYPTDQLVQGLKSDRAIVVDVGGSTGADLLKFQTKHPDLPAGGLINQDLEEVIKDIPMPEGITAMVQDVFKPQAVKGARCYLMHFVLHGFNDAQSAVALGNLAAVLEPGYSKMLLIEKVIDDENLIAANTAMDLNMMSLLSAKERTKQDWTRLLSKAGLKISNIYTHPSLNEFIIEAELATYGLV